MVLFQTLHVFFVIRFANREIFHVAVTRHPTAGWAGQQIVECGGFKLVPRRRPLSSVAPDQFEAGLNEARWGSTPLHREPSNRLWAFK